VWAIAEIVRGNLEGRRERKKTSYGSRRLGTIKVVASRCEERLRPEREKQI